MNSSISAFRMVPPPAPAVSAEVAKAAKVSRERCRARA
jgi:hypothetical protein